MDFVSVASLFLLASLSLCTGQLADNVESVTDCSCERRYFKHYEAKRCEPIFDDFKTCQCPKRYECDSLVLNPNVCELNGITYQLGERVNSTNDCLICNCRKNFLTGVATIDCIGIECPHHFRRPTRGCFLTYDTGRCCPVEKCDSELTDQKENLKVCSYNGEDYKIGQKIYPEQDPCLICLCTDNWTGVNNDSCYTFNCELEKDIHKLKKGCVPIYHEKTCCPIEYHCPNENANVTVTAVEATSPKEGKCYFEGRNYGIGEILDIKHPTNCVSCQCQVPPDFTCIHRSCVSPPNIDNCVPNYKPNACCAEYNCTTPEVKDPKTIVLRV